MKQDSKEHPEVLDMLKAMFDLGGEATCKKVGEILDKHPTSCNSIGKNLGKRAKNRFNLAPCMVGEIERFFVIPFVGRYIYQNGTSLYSWKIRPELKEALESMD